jgi:hypothetical protein
LLYLQIIMEMQEQMTGAGSLDIFKKPDHILLFVKHVLVSTTSAPSPAKPPQKDKARKGVRMADLRFTSTEDSLSDDSAGDADGPNVIAVPDVEMLETALNLLLAILEGLFLHTVPPLFISMPQNSQFRTFRQYTPNPQRHFVIASAYHCWRVRPAPDIGEGGAIGYYRPPRICIWSSTSFF